VRRGSSSERETRREGGGGLPGVVFDAAHSLPDGRIRRRVQRQLRAVCRRGLEGARPPASLSWGTRSVATESMLACFYQSCRFPRDLHDRVTGKARAAESPQRRA